MIAAMLEVVSGFWDSVANRVVARAPDYLSALLVLALFYGLHRAVRGTLRRGFARTCVDEGLQAIVLRLSRLLILVLGVLAAATQTGLEVGSLLAGLGILGIAVGLAAQDLFANLLAGLTILWDRPFRLGDWVTVGSTSGDVVDIGLRTTRLRTADRRIVILPNREVISGAVVNHTALSERRLHLTLDLALDTDLARARTAILEAAGRSPGVLADPAPHVVLVGLGEAGIRFELRGHLVNPREEVTTRSDFLEHLHLALAGAGIEWAIPRRVVELVGQNREAPFDQRERPE